MKYRKKPVVITAERTRIEQDIETLEGTMHASVGDYIITGINGEKYPCKPDIFEKTYENVEENMESGGVDFGTAIKLMKLGTKMCREGWNGKEQYIELATNISYMNADGDIVNTDHDAIGNKAIAFVGTSGVQMGWLASQSDMLAEDWCIYMTEKEAREAGVLNG